jgi:hypothetical protein
LLQWNSKLALVIVLLAALAALLGFADWDSLNFTW